MLETKVTELLGQLADKLGVASAKIWEWSLLQVKVDIYKIFLEMGLLLVVLVACTLLMRYIFNMMDKNEDYLDTHIGFVVSFAFVILALAGLTLTIICTIDLFSLPQLLFNPEYAAFQNILEQLGRLK